MTKTVRAAVQVVFLMLAAAPALAAGPTVTVYKSPTCGCCTAWVEYMQKNGFKVITKDVDQQTLMAKKGEHGVPRNFGSCHTARVGGYTIEGHVPASDIRRLLAQKPDIIGLAAPGMPASSPGMDDPRKIPYAVLTIDKKGDHKIYARH